MSQLKPARVWLYSEPFAAILVEPNCQAHMSAFSSPVRVDHQALRSGSLIASSSSCAMTDAMPSAPELLLGLIVWASQAEGQRSELPTNEYLMSAPAMLADV